MERWDCKHMGHKAHKGCREYKDCMLYNMWAAFLSSRDHGHDRILGEHQIAEVLQDKEHSFVSLN